MSDATFMCRCEPVEKTFPNAKPIIFNTEMTKAILEDRKTVTRRVIKQQPANIMTAEERTNRALSGADPYGFCVGVLDTELLKKAPYRPGSILYVRETWDFRPDNELGYIYRADYKGPYTIKWRPSIHMPRKAARIFLKVKDIRVERLQDITHGEIEKEGIVTVGTPGGPDRINPFFAFKSLWDSTIKPKDRAIYGWDANPYVWCVSFERISKEEAER